MDPKLAQNLKPTEMLSLARSHGRSGFAEAVGAPLLLVRLDDPTSDFAVTIQAALEDAPTSGGQRPELSMGFETVVGNMDTLRSASLTAARARARLGSDAYTELARAPHFAVPLHKRKGATSIFAERITVGRSRTNDVVLRHHSVSKFQAWFECDDEERWSVTDARSTNPTLLNGETVSRTASIVVVPGDEVRFGDVTCHFTTPLLLWDALMLPPPPSSRAPRR